MNSEETTDQAKSKADFLLYIADRIINILGSSRSDFKETIIPDLIIPDLRNSVLHAIKVRFENLIIKVRGESCHIDDFLDLDKQAIFIVGSVNEQSYPPIKFGAVALVDNPETLPETTERRRLMRIDKFQQAMDRLLQQLMTGRYDNELTEDPSRLIFQAMV